jgi:hypothetical protein
MHTMQLRRIIGYLQKLLYTVKRMSPTPTLNIYLFEGPIVDSIIKSRSESFCAKPREEEEEELYYYCLDTIYFYNI